MGSIIEHLKYKKPKNILNKGMLDILVIIKGLCLKLIIILIFLRIKWKFKKYEFIGFNFLIEGTSTGGYVCLFVELPTRTSCLSSNLF